MAYAKQVWENAPSEKSPLSAPRLNHLETQYDQAVSDSASFTLSQVSGVRDEVQEVKDTLNPLQGDIRLSAILQKTSSIIAFTGSSTTASPTGYVRQVFSRLSTEYPPGGYFTSAAMTSVQGVNVVNLGINGATSATYLPPSTVSALKAVSPDIVIHAIGSNDWKNGVAVPTFKSNVSSQVSSLSAPGRMQILLHQQERADSISNSYSWNDFGTALREIAESRGDTVLLDISKPFRSAGVGQGLTDPLGLLKADKIHLSTSGEASMSHAVLSALGVPPISDTGWVDLSPYLSGGASLTSGGFVRGKRSGGTVTIQVYELLSSFPKNSTANFLTGVPGTLLPSSWQVWGPAWGDSTVNRVGTMTVRAAGTVGAVFSETQTKIQATATFLV